MNTENNQQNIQKQEEGYYIQPPPHEDGMSFLELFSIIWKGKWLIISIVFLFTLGAAVIALLLPNEYKATAVVQPNDSGGSGKLASLAGQFGGLASLAGINLAAGESSDAVIAMEIIESWAFLEKFIEKHELSVPLFASKGWEQSTNTLVLDDDIYDAKEGSWIREAPKGKTVDPTSWELYEEFKQRLNVSQDKETGLISISVTHYSPFMAKQWINLLLQDINLYMKERALKEANESIKYLEEQINQTSVAEIRTVFSELIQEQHKTRMLAQISSEYVFKSVSAAKVPEDPVKPFRLLIIIIGLSLGLILGLATQLLIHEVHKEAKLGEK